MKALTVNEIREAYLSFFESKAHLRLPSFPLIPENDPSILLINAGMTPMKKWFTGAEIPPSPRVTTCQKCIRTPDIERVGHTARHGTFFEMLGNFSFGDYFKKEIISWAWEFCTVVLEMPESRLFVSVYEDDAEAYEIWRQDIGLAASKIFRFGKEDNFWEHGTGPCGPCSEIFFDRGEQYGCGRPDCTVGCDCDRYIEFWNLVFTQFNRLEDGSYVPLEHKNIDTGAGLERFAVIMQDAANFFAIDNIKAIVDEVARLAQITYGQESKNDIALRVISDHIRSTSMMIADGIVPSNEGRGYVLRRLLRRAARYGRLLNIPSPFLANLAELVFTQSGAAYPELRQKREQIKRVILREEESFAQTIQQGLALLQEEIEEAKARGSKVLGGAELFRLHDTFGFPLDLTREIAAEQDLSIDEAGFAAAMQAQKERGRKAQLEKTGSAWDKNTLPEQVDRQQPTQFSGYDTLTGEAPLLYLLQAGAEGLQICDQVEAGAEAIFIFAQTPFYGESGGQTGDQGLVSAGQAQAKVYDTSKTGDGIVLHHAKIVAGQFTPGLPCCLSVDSARRLATARNHSCTHLLHAALIEVLGEHVEQAGSLVSADRLRFDFRHFQAISKEELLRIEEVVNQAIWRDLPIQTELMDIAAAKRSGAAALFSEKYGAQVRVVSMGDFSKELCGGTHLQHSSQACCFRIVSEGGVAAGVRRIEAVTASAAMSKTWQEQQLLTAAASLFKSREQDVVERIQVLQDEKRQLEKELSESKKAEHSQKALSLASKGKEVAGCNLIRANLGALDSEALRTAGDLLRQHDSNNVVVLVAEDKAKLLWLITAGKDALSRGVHCGNLIREAARLTGGGGGGRPDMAQAGGKDASQIEPAFALIEELIQAQVNS